MEKLEVTQNIMPFGCPRSYFHRLPMLQMCEVCSIKTKSKVYIIYG